MQYDNFYHEHMSYYSINTLVLFLKRFNMEIFDIKFFPKVRTGSTRFYVKYIEKFCSNKSQIALATYTANTSEHLDIVKIINNVFKYKFNNFNKNCLLSSREIQFFYYQNQK